MASLNAAQIARNAARKDALDTAIADRDAARDAVLGPRQEFNSLLRQIERAREQDKPRDEILALVDAKNSARETYRPLEVAFTQSKNRLARARLNYVEGRKREREIAEDRELRQAATRAERQAARKRDLLDDGEREQALDEMAIWYHEQGVRTARYDEMDETAVINEEVADVG